MTADRAVTAKGLAVKTAVEGCGNLSSAITADSIAVDIFRLDVHSRAIVTRYVRHIPALGDQPQRFGNADRPRLQWPL